MIKIDPDSQDPVFEQLRQQVTSLAITGDLSPESRLPSVRQLASDLRLAPGTVARAYQELERDGIIQTRGRKGTFIAGAARKIGQQRRKQQLRDGARSFAALVKQLDVSSDEAIEAVRKCFS